MNFREWARSIVMGIENEKWYVTESRIATALENAYYYGQQSISGQLDEYAPPVGRIECCDQCAALHSAGRTNFAHVTEKPGTVRVPVMTALKPVYMGLGFGYPPQDSFAKSLIRPMEPSELIDNNDGSHLEPVPGDRQSYEEG